MMVTTTNAVTFRRSGSRVTPREQEDLAVRADGSFAIWRAVNAGPIGRFGGTLADPDGAAVREAVATAGSAAGPPAFMVLDAVSETVTIGRVNVTVGRHDVPDAAWGDLFVLLRRFLDEGTDRPLAAVALETDARGTFARLVQRGPDALEVDLSRVTLGAQVFGPGYSTHGQWSTVVQAGGRGPVGPGWSLDLPFDHGLELTADRVVQVRVEFVAYDGVLAVPVMILASPAPPA
jgi:hypothetical protein